MDTAPMYIAAGIAVLMIVLGFVALLKQKVYLDNETKQPVSFEIPFVGKMTANVPALAFVFLGFALAVYGIQRYAHKEVKWMITGTLKPDKPVANWQGTRLRVFPIDVDAKVDPATGRFNFELLIPEGQTFEGLVGKMYFDAEFGGTELVPSIALDLHQHKDASSMLANATDTTRDYVIPLNVMPPAN
jgi:hypothetical protein